MKNEVKVKKMNKEKTPAVFVVNEGFHDLSPAKKFGKITYLTSQPKGLSPLDTSNMARIFHGYIEASEPHDYILVTSLTIMVSIFSTMFGIKHKRLNLLIYKSPAHDYEVRRLDFNRKKEEE